MMTQATACVTSETLPVENQPSDPATPLQYVVVFPVSLPVTRLQSRQRPFACDECGYRCARDVVLTAHKRLHDAKFRRTHEMLMTHQLMYERKKEAERKAQRAKGIKPTCPTDS